jgi:hypothetical protein
MVWYILLDSSSIFYSGQRFELDTSSQRPFDKMLLSTDMLAKSFYSAILADLGSNGSNILTDEAALRYYTGRFKDIHSTLVSSGPATDSYDALKAGPGKPKITPSTIYTTYLCQTPKRKLTTALIVAVLLADLVLLRALWSILSLGTVHYVKSKDPRGELRVEPLLYMNMLTNTQRMTACDAFIMRLSHLKTERMSHSRLQLSRKSSYGIGRVIIKTPLLILSLRFAIELRMLFSVRKHRMSYHDTF